MVHIKILEHLADQLVELAEDNHKVDPADPYFQGKADAYEIAAGSVERIIESHKKREVNNG